jgi:homogentisate phytyltransferase/homogentisate geranylgeranyltransferase
MSMRQGKAIVALMGLLAVAGAWAAGPWLLLTVLVILLIGTAYSVPPLRLKRLSLWAAISIALARGVVANVGVALHYNDVFGGLADFSPATLAVMAAFFFGFGLVIAIYKDIPDLMGDQAHNIQTFTVRLGAQRAFDLGRAILTTGYVGVMAVALTRLPQPDGVLLLAAQGAFLALFWLVSRRVNPSQKASIARFYMFLWGLFYAQYVVLSLYQVARGAV